MSGKSNVVSMAPSEDVTVDDMIRQCVEMGRAVLTGELAPVKADKAIRASAVAAKWTELRLKYGDNARIILHGSK